MAKVKSLWGVQGNVGDAAFFIKNGAQHLGQSTTLGGQRIKSDPAFARTRENMMEFAGVAKATQSLRLGFSEIIRTFADKTFSNRLHPLFRQMVKAASGVRGKRPIEILNERAKLHRFEFNKSDPFLSACTITIVHTVNAARDGASIAIPAFTPRNGLTIPEGATHFSIVLAVGTLSDHTFSVDEGKYLPADPELNGLGKAARTAILSLDQAVPAVINLAATVDLPGPMTTTTALLVALGVEFYTEASGVFYPMAMKNAMHIRDIA